MGAAATEEAIATQRRLTTVSATLTATTAAIVVGSLPFSDPTADVTVVAATVLAGAIASSAAYAFLPRLPWMPFAAAAVTIAALLAWTGGSSSPYRTLVAVLLVGGATLDRLRDVAIVAALAAATLLSPLTYEPNQDFPLLPRVLEAASWALAATVVAGVSASLRVARRHVEDQAGFVSAVLGSLPQQAAVVDRSGRIVLTNRAWDRVHALTGASPAEVGVGADYARVSRTTSSDRHSIDRLIGDLRAVLDGHEQAAMTETALQLADGRRYVFSVRTTALPSGAGAVVTYEDITPILEAEQVRRTSLERLRHLDQRKDALLRAVSHDVRTPLTIIRGAAELLDRADTTLPEPERVQLTEALTRQTRRLERMLAGLLVLAVDQRDRSPGGLDLARQRIALRGLIDEIVEPLETPSHEIRVRVPDMIVTVDPWAVGSIVDRLLHNALKHTPPGTTIVVDASYDEDRTLTLCVADDGPGIPDEEHDHVFRSFEVGTHTRHHDPGAGIGLAVVATLATLHDGDVRLETPQGGGARFVVTLATDGRGSPETSGAGA